METRKGSSLIIQAVEKNNKPALLFLINSIPKIDIDAQDITGKTAVFIAVFYQYNDLLKILLKAKANPNIQNYFGWTPLMQARFQRNYAAIEMLLDAKADTQVKNLKNETIYEMDFGDNNPFITPIVFNKVATLKNLLSHQKPENFSHLIQLTLKLKKHHCLEVLLKHKPDLDQENYLEMALNNEDFNSFHLLLKAGSNPNVKDPFGNSMLHICVYEKKHPYVLALLEYKADVNVIDKQGETPLMLAIEENDAISIKAISEKTPNLSLQNNLGKSALSLMEEKTQKKEEYDYRPSPHSFFSQNVRTLSLTTGAFCVGFLAYHLLHRTR